MMDKDEIIRMAREACLHNQTLDTDPEFLTRFATLVAAPWIETNKSLVKEIIELKKQAEQEPVAEVHNTDTPSNWSIIKPGLPAGTKLYAAPVRTKDLMDDEAQKLWNDTSSIVPMWAHHLHFARAVIAADREKNK